MTETAGTFSESWYRIADSMPRCDPTSRFDASFTEVNVGTFFTIPLIISFFRLRPSAYDFIARLRLNRTIEHAWKEAAAANPEEAPGQEDIIRLLSQLYSANLLHSDLPPDSTNSSSALSNAVNEKFSRVF